MQPFVVLIFRGGRAGDAVLIPQQLDDWRRATTTTSGLPDPLTPAESIFKPRYLSILKANPIATIAIAQLLGTSLWFSANSAADDLRRAWGASLSDIGLLTSAVQLGFILGTLVVSITGLADRFPASRIFACSAVVGAIFNASFAWFSHGLISAAILRFLVGICLAGIYPIGMKLVVTWAPDRTGAALAYLVGMLTLGTALPHGVRYLGAKWPWQSVITSSSTLAVMAALLIITLGDGPHLKKSTTAGEKRLGEVLIAFRSQSFRAAAFGYFGHMWELYTFWTIVPVLVSRAALHANAQGVNISGAAFAIIASGALGCIVGGVLSQKIGSARVAAGALIGSGLCCLVFALGWREFSPFVLFAVFLVWGITVVADSPQFSALSAKACPPELVGSALAIQNSAGFAITIISIALATALFDRMGLDIAWMLVPGPLLGLAGLYPLWGKGTRAGPYHSVDKCLDCGTRFNDDR